jgi:polysaccharide biosynthesis protein PslG
VTVVLAAHVVLAVGTLSAPARAGVPADFFGVYTELVQVRDGNARRAALDAQSQVGARVLVEPFDWIRVETAPGRYDHSFYDRVVGEAADRGLRILPVVYNTPDFRSTKPATGGARGMYPPRNPADLGGFIAELIRRYGPEGTLWAERDRNANILSLGATKRPRQPIRAWQVWNEPDVPYFWPSGPNPAQYADLLKHASKAIKAADPGAEVVAAGLSNHGLASSWFLQGMYDAGAASAFHTLAIHPYASDVTSLFDQTRRVRQVMDANGDIGKRLWLTEFGWATAGIQDPIYSADEQCQAALIAGALTNLAVHRDALLLRGAAYFMWNDREPNPTSPESWAFNTGLVRRTGQPKPGFFAYRDAVSALVKGGTPVALPGCPLRSSLIGAAPRGKVPVRLVLGGRRVQRVVKQGAVSVLANCAPNPCRLRGTGRVWSKAGSRRVRLRGASHRLGAPKRVRLSLRLPPATRAFIKRELAARHRVVATVRVRARYGEAGGQSAARRRIRVSG